MAKENKRYYWIQLTQEFFYSKEMKLLRKIAGGDTHTIIYLKMMLVSLENNGMIFYDGLADNLAEEISLMIDENVEDIKITLLFLEAKGLLTKSSDREYILEQVPEMIGSETATARRVRKHREHQKALQCNTAETNRNGEIEKEIEKELDIETEIEKKDGNSLSVIAQVYQQKIGLIDGGQFQRLTEYATLDGMNIAVILKAISEAADNGKRNFKYINAILRNWKQDGIKTLVQVEERERQRIERRAKSSGSNSPQPSNVPSWSNPDYKEPEMTAEDEARLQRIQQEIMDNLGKGGK